MTRLEKWREKVAKKKFLNASAVQFKNIGFDKIVFPSARLMPSNFGFKSKTFYFDKLESYWIKPKRSHIGAWKALCSSAKVNVNQQETASSTQDDLVHQVTEWIAHSELLSPETKKERVDWLLDTFSDQFTLFLKKKYICAITMKSFMKAQDFQECAGMGSSNILPLYIYGVQGLCLNNCFDEAIKLLKNIDRNLYPTDHQQLSSIIFQAITSAGHLNRAVEFIKNHPDFQIGPMSLHAFFQAILESKKLKDDCKKVLMDIAKTHPSAPVFIKTLYLIGKTFRLADLEKLLLQMKNTGLSKGDLGMYVQQTKSNNLSNTYIQGLCKKALAENNIPEKGKLLAKASSFWTTFKRSRIYVERDTYVLMLEAFASTSNYTRCKNIMTSMIQRGLVPDTTCYFHLIDSYGQRGSVLLIRDIIQEMIDSGIPPNLGIMNRFIKIYLNQTEPNFCKAFDLLNELPKMYLEPNHDTRQLFHDALSRIEDQDLIHKWTLILKRHKFVG